MAQISDEPLDAIEAEKLLPTHTLDFMVEKSLASAAERAMPVSTVYDAADRGSSSSAVPLARVVEWKDDVVEK